MHIYSTELHLLNLAKHYFKQTEKFSYEFRKIFMTVPNELTRLDSLKSSYRRNSPYAGPGSSLSASSYSQICRMLINGNTIHQICEQTAVSDYTIKGIKRQIRDEIPDWKKNISRRMEEVITALVDSLESDLRNDRLSPDRKAIAIGILVDKREKLGDSVRADLTSKVTAESSQVFSRRLNEWVASLAIQNTGE